MCHARLLAAGAKESGAWLHALPIDSVGLRLDDNSVRIAVGLRLGVPVCGAHKCHHCGADVNEFGRHVHGLSCRKSEGRHQRHAALNNIILSLPVCQLAWSHQAFQDLTGRGQMESPLCPGGMGDF